MPDYHYVRDLTTCPLCNGVKTTGLLVCWPCYRSHDVREGLYEYIVTILDDVERNEEMKDLVRG